MAKVEEEFPILSVSEVFRSKDWSAGSKEHITHTEYVASRDGSKYTFELKKIIYPPALINMSSELIVNAVDHYINSANSIHQVTFIDISYDVNGLKVTNDGNGIRVDWHPVAKLWIPRLIFGERDRGSNMKKSEDSITGGVNGLGTKVVNTHANLFSVETVYKSSSGSIYYYQKWDNHMETVYEPIIVDLQTFKRIAAVSQLPSVTTPLREIKNSDNTTTYIINVSDNNDYRKLISPEKRRPHTTFIFQPDYSLFGNPSIDVITEVLQTLAIKTSAYTGPKCKISFNGSVIPQKSITDILKIMFPNETVINTRITPSNNGIQGYSWEIAFVITSIPPADELQTLNQISVVNGISVQRGEHLRHIRKQILAGFKEINNKKNVNASPSLIDSNLFIGAVVKIGGAKWDSQSKKEMQINAQKLKSYVIDEKIINQVCKQLYDKILQVQFIAQDAKTITTKRKNQINVDKLIDADYAGTAKSSTCVLMLAEGDSAIMLCKEARTTRADGKYVLGPEYYGIYPTGGVIINVRKATTPTTVAGKTRLIQNEQLKKNKFWNNFLLITGLNPDYQYNPDSKTYSDEIKTLRYGSILVCVDQDLDGKGNIFPLIFNMFDRFWPALNAANFVRRLNTPVKRAYERGTKKGKKIYDFYTIAEFEQWKKNIDPSKYEMKHYKGLGSHEFNERKNIIINFFSNVLSYPIDNDTSKLFELYYGKKNEDLRKAEYRKPLLRIEAAEEIKYSNDQEFPISLHILTEAKEFGLDDIQRKLWSAIDGMNESGRKVLYGILDYFKNHTAQAKISTLGSHIGSITDYEHGEASLFNVLTNKGFVEVGGIQLPQIIPKGSFGNRAGEKAAAPRYIFALPNSDLLDLLFNKYDNHLLTRRIGDSGEAIEPLHYIPILPTAITEHAEIPSHGWKMSVWARDVFDVIANVHRLIDDDREQPYIFPMSVYARGHKNRIKYLGKVPYSFGEYTQNGNTVVINELPLRVWTKDYYESLKSMKVSEEENYAIFAKSKLPADYAPKPFIDEIIDHSGSSDVNIIIKFAPGALAIIEGNYGDGLFATALEDYLGLYNAMNSCLNLLGPDETVIEFRNYEDILRYWFTFRKDLYIARYTRLLIIDELEIKLLSEIIRYIENYREMKLIDIPESEAEVILAANKFVRIDPAAANYFKSYKTEELNDAFYGAHATYNYLFEITDRQKLKKSLDERKKKLATLEEKHNEMKVNAYKGRFIGAYYWHRELDELEKIIKSGFARNWGAEPGEYEFVNSRQTTKTLTSAIRTGKNINKK